MKTETSHCFSIIGLPGVGKSTWGKSLAKELGFHFIDTDDEITKRFGATPREIITTLGEEDFRTKEAQVLKEIIKKKPQKTIISCGGGIVLKEENRKLLRKKTTVLYLQRDLSDFSLSEKELQDRPLLQDIENIYNERKELYEMCAHKTIKTK